MAIGLDDIIILGRVFLAVRRWRERRKLRKALKEISMLEGKKTYIGIGTVVVGLVLGWLGIGGEAEAQTLVTQVVQALDSILQVVGLLVATYGRWAAKP